MVRDFSYGIIPVYKNNNGDYEFLVINQKTYNGSFWGFPKGHAELGETEIETAKRELKEEVGIPYVEIDENKSGEFNYKFKIKGLPYDKTVKYRLGFVADKTNVIQVEELNSCKWVNYDQVLQQLTHKNMIKIFIEITKGLF